MRSLWLLVPVLGCSEYNVDRKPDDNLPDTVEDTHEPPAADTAEAIPGQIQISPATHDFGALLLGEEDDLIVEISNIGAGELTISEVNYETDSTSLSITALEESAPFVLQPAEAVSAVVHFSPQYEGPTSGTVVVVSDDPEQPTARATQQGEGILPETQCYILDDGIAHETTSSPDHVVDYHGDPDLYWYEPSGQHGMLDKGSDFSLMISYVASKATAEKVVWPLSFQSNSTLSTFNFATFTYVMCSFWVDPAGSPDDYTLTIGSVDDGVQILLNGAVVDYLTLGNSGNWTLSETIPGTLNTVIITLVDDSAVNRYMRDMTLYYQGKPL